ncbi:MAG: tripartite tricarboxylate transporter substrate-binding protein [Alphaproteobacteria bacterium]|nr:tripartite tricarboxylate transporter substrate-binding protein [Alphaproteobacteria bacterium]
MRHATRLTIPALAGLGIAMAGCVNQASAQSVAEFYKGKTIKVILSAGPGGGYATFANTLMKHMGKYIPGNPNFIRQHRQGAAGLVAANWIYHKAPKDGTVIALIHRGAVSTLPIFSPKNVKYDPTKFGWIGSMNASIGFCVAWHTQPVKTFKDVFTQPLIVGGLAAGSDTDIFPKVFNNLFGTKFKLITGYSSGTAINLAMERGEVQGRCGWSWSAITSTRADWLRDKKITLLTQVSLRKHPKLPDVPLVTEFASEQSQREVLELVLSPQAMGRPFLAPPKVPADRLKALQAAFDKSMQDKDLQADAKKIRLEINSMSGKEIEALITKIYSMPKDVVAAAQDATKRTDRLEVTVKKTPAVTIDTALTEIKSGGRQLYFVVKGKTEMVRISGSRTKVSIKGKKTKRKNLKVGMKCKVSYKGSGSTASAVACN